MMANKAKVFEDVMTPEIADMGDDYFVDITVECVELHDEWEVDYIRAPQKISQCGIFEDANGTQVRFKAWEASEPPEFEEGRTYEMSEMQMVYGKNAESYALVIRSATQATPTTGFPSAMRGQECKECGTSLSEDDLYSGPEAPAIGWEYYECPDCNERMRPNGA